MHHGYYVPENRTDHVQAQIDLIDEVLNWASVDNVKSMIDVGCGIGGSSRHIARKFNCSAQGITLSPYQAIRATELAVEQGLSDATSFQVGSILNGLSNPFVCALYIPHTYTDCRLPQFSFRQVADALEMPFDNNTFDLVWSLESGEHMPDKPTFVNELVRVAAPGGRIIIVTWCHRELRKGENSLTSKEIALLRMINRAYYLPRWCSGSDYVKLLENNGCNDVRTADWSPIVAPFWKAVIESSKHWRSIWGLLRSGLSTQRGAIAMFLMLRGFKMGLIKFVLITCTKPDQKEGMQS